MEITEVRIRLLGEDEGAEKLRAFCSVTFDESFVVHDLKVIEGPQGTFVAMPTRRAYERCPGCGGKNHAQARFCNDCGQRTRPRRNGDPKATGHIDVAHPITADFRRVLHEQVVAVYQREVDRRQSEGEGVGQRAAGDREAGA